MKKITLIKLLLFICATTSAQTFTQDEIKFGWKPNSELSFLRVDETINDIVYNSVELVSAGDEPHINHKGILSTSNITHIHLIIRNNTSNIDAVGETAAKVDANNIRIMFPNGNGGNTSIYTTITSGDTSYKTYSIQLSGEAGWSGGIADKAFKLKFTNSDNPGELLVNGSIFVNKIVFDNNATLDTDKLENISDFKFYPNPTKDVINIQNTLNIDQINIYNISGEKVLNKNIMADKDSQINISNLRAGIYVMSVLSRGNEKSYKIVKTE